MTRFTDNQPKHRNFKKLSYLSVEFRIVAKSEVKVVDACDPCDPTRQTIIVEPIRTEGPADAQDIATMIGREFVPPVAAATTISEVL